MQEQAAGKQVEELQRELAAARDARVEAEAQAQQLQQLTDRLQGSADEAAAAAEAADAEINAAREAAACAEAQVAQLQSQAEEARTSADATSRELSEAQTHIQVACRVCPVLIRHFTQEMYSAVCSTHTEHGGPLVNRMR